MLGNVGDVTASNITGNITVTVIPARDRTVFETQAFPLYSNEIVDLGALIATQRSDGRSDLKPRERIAIFAARDYMIRPKWAEISTGHELLYCFGYVTFHDADGVARDTGFFRTYFGKYGKWETKDDPDYEWS